jgi:hypothetical protein
MPRQPIKTDRWKRPLVGWREYVALPDYGVEKIKAKVDTGARSSSLHAFDIEPFQHGSVDWIAFSIHPVQHSRRGEIRTEAPLLEYRHVRSSNGHSAERPVVRTSIVLGEFRWVIDLTLTSRDEMGFRMLLGRQAIRKRFLVDTGRSFLSGWQPE